MPHAAPLFSVRGLSKVFDGTTAICSIDLDILEGQCLLIAGSNGSGKTVLVRMLIGLMDPSAGTILFRGKALDRSIRHEVGMIFQDADAQIIGETVAEDTAFGPKNLRMTKSTITERVRAALEAMSLIEKSDFLAQHLSGGEKRRLAIAGVLAMGCSTIIMDEPFANLDWCSVVSTVRTIGRLKAEGKTLIILTHELEKVLALADRLVILHRGIVREDGEPEAVLNRLDPSCGVRDPRHSYLSVADCIWDTITP
ncbi:MAG: energy-coupling factor ABC transporter ATP-binding protein [Spirochaetaceae bacterium]|jgi:biotin transport system ATP-binding protein|nr:energy-coupling factor ABC transporter ATP-binding protein [Spirochaetaceae bacterium]